MNIKSCAYGRAWVLAPLVLLCGGAWAESITVDGIIDRYAEAIGGYGNIAAVENIVYSNGTYEEGDYRGNGDSTMSVARPWFKLVGDKTDPGGYMEGYDGAAWEWFADPGIVVRTVGPASEAIRHYAGAEHPLFQYRDKGSAVELLGESELDQRPVQVLRLTRRDGFVEQFYIDKETFLINASGGAAPLHAFGDSITTVTRIGDYREVGGVLLPHRFTTVEVPSGRPVTSMQWGRIEVNRELPDDWFSPPEFRRTLLQHFIESLYGQRSDIDSVMWTYHEFIRAYPDLDTSDAVSVAGFQILKMGETDAAIALLERNAADYPAAANARFGLGRAYQTAGQIDRARAEYRAAIGIDRSHERARQALQKLTE